MLPDLTYSLGHRRNHHAHRLTLVARSIPELIQELDAFAIKEDSVKIKTSFTPRPEIAPRVAFVMSGQGPQWWAMGRQLLDAEPVGVLPEDRAHGIQVARLGRGQSANSTRR